MNRYLRTYLLAIVLPALAVAWGGMRLLRIDARNRAALVADNRRLVAERCAEEFHGFVRFLHDPFLDRLAAAPDPDARLAVLRDLARNEPAVRAAFLWREGEGCIWPRRIGCTEEERRFLNRYESLFSGAVPWSPPAASAAPAAGASGDTAQPVRGFRPWSSGDRSDLLAWVRVAPDEIAGFELETMWLLSMTGQYRRDILDGIGIRNTFLRSERTAMPHESGEILDESGTILVSSRYELAEASDLDPAAEVPLAPFFPHWRLRVRSTAASLPFYDWMPGSVLDGLLGAPATRRALGAALLALVLLSLSGGGLALLRAARRERLDAVRKTDFVSNVSHELRTPLTSIRMFSELLAEDRIADPDRRRRALATIAAESERLSRLVDGVLDFSRLERNRRKYDLRRVDLAELVEEMRDAPAHCGFRMADCERGAAALADRDAVRQIVLNLLDNAAKYAPGAPPEVSVRAGVPRGAGVLRGAGNGAVSLSVADRGPGVPPRAAKRIFDRFYRVDDSTTRETGGSGLGLSIARRLARGMGGDLVYRPREGGGSVFELTLPAAPDAGT